MSVELMFRATEREARVWAKLWQSGIVSNFVAPVLLLVAMGVGLGELVDADRGDLGGLDYIAFVTPGLLVATAVQTAAGESLWPVMAGHRWIGFHYTEVASPLRPADIYGGHVVWTATRSLLQASVFVAAGAALGGVASWWGLLAIPVAALTAIAVGAPLAAFAAWQDTDAAFDVIMRVVIVPLTLFSGTLFPIDQLPVGLRFATQLFPLYHGVELARAATTGRMDAGGFGHVGVLVVYVGVGWWWGTRTFQGRLAA